MAFGKSKEFEIRLNGRLLNPNSLENALKKHLEGTLTNVVQSVEMMADISTKECAEELLKESLKIVPIAKEANEENDFTFTEISRGNILRMTEWGVFGDKQFEDRAKDLKINAENHLTKGEYIQFKDHKSQLGERHYIGRDATRQRIFEHNAEALFDSGRVDSLRDDKNNNHKKIIGYKVSYDTRRTDTRSFVNNFNYAIKQHEDSTLKHAPGKSSHFLLKPYINKKDEFMKKLEDMARKAVVKGAKKK